MRIAQIIDALRPAGGAERLQISFAEAIQDRPVELSVLTLGKNDPGMEANLRALGVDVQAFPASSLVAPRRAARLIQSVRESRFDLLHTHLVRSTLLGGLTGRVCGVPVVSTIHNTQHNRRLSRVLRWAEGQMLRRGVDRVIAVGWLTAEVHAARVQPRAIDVIPNAVPPFDPGLREQRSMLRRELGAEEGDTVLVSVGRLHPQKGYDHLLDAFRSVCAHRKDVRLWIVGSGQLAEPLARAAADPAFEGRLSLLGLREDVPRLLAASDCYVSAARWEGLPVSILEAMSAGLPIIATRVGDVPRIVDERNGCLVPAASSVALGDAIDGALADRNRLERWGTEGARRARLEFGTEAWADQILGLYAEVIDEAGGTRARIADAPHPRGARCES